MNFKLYMNEFEYSNRMMSPCRSAFPPLTRQSLNDIRLNVLGLTSEADANQPQNTWMSDGAQSDRQVLEIWTMYCGMPEEVSRPWNMLISLFVHTSADKTQALLFTWHWNWLQEEFHEWKHLLAAKIRRFVYQVVWTISFGSSEPAGDLNLLSNPAFEQLRSVKPQD